MHDWYDWAKDIVLPLLTGGGALVVGLAALRVARRGHELAQLAELREARTAGLAIRQRIAEELQDLCRVRVWADSPPERQMHRPGIRILSQEQADHLSDRKEAEIAAIAKTLAAGLDPRDRQGFGFLLNYINRILKPADGDEAQTLISIGRAGIDAWVRDPDAFLDGMWKTWPQLEPEQT